MGVTMRLRWLLFLTLIPVTTSTETGASPPYPGPSWASPQLHHSPNCLHVGGWHDVAGALSYKGWHHVFQGCPASGGWSHAASSDLVHWEDRGIHVSARHETYAGMDSDDSPCSGFVAVNDKGVPCAGFRQCGSSHGVTDLNPEAQAWDVPLEVRCAENENLTSWGRSQWIYDVYFYRALPYDPVRPWKDEDGKWYSALSTDGCNSTTRHVPCSAGGRLDLWTAQSFDGPWTQIAPMFTTNRTMSGFQSKDTILGEFVTSGYFGGLPGDPQGGKTRVITQNREGATYWVGNQVNGGEFTPFWDKPGAVGFYDYGSLTMARTLGSDPNQVAVNGRRVLVGWIGGTPASQSLGRDLTLSPDFELLQQFIPELKMLRVPGSHGMLHWPQDTATVAEGVVTATTAQQFEVTARFSFSSATPPVAPFGLNILCASSVSQAASGCVGLIVDCSQQPKTGVCTVGVNATAQGGETVTGPLILPATGRSISLHAIVDHSIIEVIYQNRTAMVVYTPLPSPQNRGLASFGNSSTVAMDIEHWNLASIR